MAAMQSVPVATGDFRVQCLGSAVLTQIGATAVGTVQKPLAELYLAYNSKSERGRTPAVRLSISNAGVWISSPDSKKAAGSDAPFLSMPAGLDMIGGDDGVTTSGGTLYSIGDVQCWEALRFETTSADPKKTTSKKKATPLFAFVPLDPRSFAALGDVSRLFTPLDKKYRHFATVSHPAIFTCVVRSHLGRRPALELHAFLCVAAEQAADISYQLAVAYQAYRSLVDGRGVFNPNAYQFSVMSPSGMPPPQRYPQPYPQFSDATRSASMPVMMADDVDYGQFRGTAGVDVIDHARVAAGSQRALEDWQAQYDVLQRQQGNTGPQPSAEWRYPQGYQLKQTDLVPQTTGNSEYYNSTPGLNVAGRAQERFYQNIQAADNESRTAAYYNARPLGGDNTYKNYPAPIQSDRGNLSSAPPFQLAATRDSNQQTNEDNLRANLKRVTSEHAGPMTSQYTGPTTGNATTHDNSDLLGNSTEQLPPHYHGMDQYVTRNSVYGVAFNPADVRQTGLPAVSVPAARRTVPQQATPGGGSVGRHQSQIIRPVVQTAIPSADIDTALDRPTAKPVAMVQPRKIQGVRVLPLTGSDPSSADLRTPKDRKQPEQDAVKRPAPNEPDVQPLQLPFPSNLFRPVAAGPVQTTSDSAVRPVQPSTSSDSSRTTGKAPPVVHTKSFGRAAGSKPIATSGKTQSALKTELSLGPVEVDNSKDAEIALLMQTVQLDGTMDKTLSPHGTNFEKSLGYFP